MGEDKCIFSKNQLNYFRVCHLAANVLPDVLREIFIKHWNSRYSLRFGNWTNERKNGEDFVRMESSANRRRNSDLLSTMVEGDITQWDCTKLFYAILFSTSIGVTLDPAVRNHVNDLREFRNESFAHVNQGEVSSSDFQKIVNKVLQAFFGLSKATSEVKRIQNQTSFSTEEVHELQQKLEREKNNQAQLDLRISDLEGRVSCLETKIEDERAVCSAVATSYNFNNLVYNESTGKQIAPSFIILPRKPAHHVIHRRHIDLGRNSLIDLNNKHMKSVTTVYITGGPGSGKTECARQIARALSARMSFVMSIDARNIERFAESLKEWAVHLGLSGEILPCLKQASVMSQIEVLSLIIKEHLVNFPTWLLIVDQLNEESRLAMEYLPQIGDRCSGQFIITTQHQPMELDDPHTSCISLSQGLSSDESFQLLSSIAGPLDHETAEIISEKLGHHPMFLVSAAHRIKQVSLKSQTSATVACKEHLESLRNRCKDDEIAYYLAALSPAMRSNLESVIEVVMKRNPVYEECFHLLVLARDSGLPVSFAIRFLSYLLKLSETEVEFLLRYCPILVFSMRGTLEFVQVNEVIYKLLCDTLLPSVRTEQMVERLRGICHFAVKNAHDPMVYKVFKQFTPQILQYLSLLDHCFPNCADQRNLHHELGKAFLCVLVDYSSAVRCLTKAMSIFENANEITHVEYARILSSIGNVFRLTGSTDEASKYLNKSLKLLKVVYNGRPNEDVANCLSSLGLVYHSQGDLDRARELHYRALTIREQIHGKDHIKTATSLNNIGGIYHERGDLGLAKEFYWKALEIKGRNYGWDFPQVANSFNNIAEISHEQGDLAGAVSIHKRALKIRQRLYGEDHPDIANSLNNIGVIYHKLQDWSSARKFHAKALEIRKKIHGQEHSEVATSLSNLGEVCYDEGDLAAAEKCHAQALCIWQRHSVQSFHPKVITSLHNLMKVYVTDQQMTTATVYAYEVFKISQQFYGLKDPRTVNAFRRVTELSNKAAQGQGFKFSLSSYEQVEKLSCL